MARPKLNCHPCKCKSVIEWTCPKCGLHFCLYHLSVYFNLVPDEHGVWPCIRCNTRDCDCHRCLSAYAKADAQLDAGHGDGVEEVEEDGGGVENAGDGVEEDGDGVEEDGGGVEDDSHEDASENSLQEELRRTKNEAIAYKELVKTQGVLYQQLQEYNTSLQDHSTKLQSDLQSANDSNLKSIAECHRLLMGYKTLLAELSSAEDSRDEAYKACEAAVKDVKYLRRALQLKEKHECQFNSINSSSALEETCASQRDHISELERQLAAANEKLRVSELSSSDIRKEYEDQKRTIASLQNQLLDGEQLRREMHHTIMDLKGNVRVFIRVRPPHDGCGVEPTVTYPTSRAGVGIDLMLNGCNFPYTFDRVFTHDASQQDVFDEVSQLVQSALDGEKVCIFAYGQTGSGKTYTMMGRPEEAQEEKGLIPRSLEKVFETSLELAHQGWKFKMQACMLEIYNEKIRDLLVIESTAAGKGKAPLECKIQEDKQGNISVTNLTIVDVQSVDEVYILLQRADRSRSVGRTEMNQESSRSHFVFRLTIDGVNEKHPHEPLNGVLNLVDLAGSEKLSRCGATVERCRETQNINKSLSTLTLVMEQLTSKDNQQHVNFRDSKLTHLLKPYLGGGTKTLMLVNVSPDPSSFGESLCSLKFAAKVNKSGEIGLPHRKPARHLDFVS